MDGDEDTAPQRKRRGVPDLDPNTVGSLNYYQVLGLGDVGDGVSSKEVKAAYRRLILKYHPDKTRRGDQDIIFISIQKAYDALREEDKRRAYDSSLPFDDSVPTATEGLGEDFYEVYQPVFRRNARFASEHPVPDLGGPDATEEEVDEFYAYWLNFESWRDFSNVAAEMSQIDLDDAGSREEKRWMQKEVQKQAKVMKKDEIRRVRTMVEQARDKDPRIRRFREEERRRRQEEKERKKEERKRRQDMKLEQERLEQEEARRREEEDRERQRQEKFNREKIKKRLRKTRNAIRRALIAAQPEAEAQANALSEEEGRGAAELASITEDALDDVIRSIGEEFGPDTLQEVLDQITEEDDPIGAYEAVMDLTAEIEEQRRVEEAERAEEEKAQREQNANEKAETSARRRRVWTKAEMALLSKAIRKFPPGTGNRWDTIATWMNGQAHTLSRHLSPALSEQDSQSSASFRPFTKEDCLSANQKVKLAPSAGTTRTGFAPPPVFETPASPPVADAASRSASDGAENKAQPAPNGNGAERRSSQNGAPSERKAASSVEDWTQEQQSQLEAGLKQFPSSMEKNERWKSIAAMVPGKKKKECIERYKFLRSAVKAKKQAS